MDDHYDTLVIGAGQAGLAAAYYLQQAGRAYVALDAHARIGDNWRERWAGLRLFTPQRYSQLPGLPPAWSTDEWYLPDRIETGNYLERYANHFSLNVRSGQQVTAVETGFTVRTGAGEVYRADHVIVATGAYRTPYRPPVARMFPATIHQVHSSEIRDVAAIAERVDTVLVVGAGASGQQLATLFAETGTEVLLAGPQVQNLPRKVAGKDVYWWMYKSGIMRLRTDRGPGKLLVSPGGEVTVGEQPAALAARPEVVRLRAHVDRYSSETLTFRETKDAPAPLQWPRGRAAAVVWCTGFRNAYPFLPAGALDKHGRPDQQGGVSRTVPNLYFVGLPNQRRVNSALLHGVGADAKAIVDALPLPV